VGQLKVCLCPGRPLEYVDKPEAGDGTRRATGPTPSRDSPPRFCLLVTEVARGGGTHKTVDLVFFGNAATCFEPVKDEMSGPPGPPQPRVHTQGHTPRGTGG